MVPGKNVKRELKIFIKQGFFFLELLESQTFQGKNVGLMTATFERVAPLLRNSDALVSNITASNHDLNFFNHRIEQI